MVREFDHVIAEASVCCNPALLAAYTDGQWSAFVRGEAFTPAGFNCDVG